MMSNARGEVKMALLALVVVVLGGVAAAVVVLGGGEDETPPMEMDEAGFEQAYVGSESQEVPDEEPALAIAEDEPELEPFDAEAWDGQFRRMDEPEFREGFRRILADREPDEFEDAVAELEREITRAFHRLEPEERRNFALNFDRNMMTAVILDALKEHNPDDYEETRENFEHWLGEGIGQQMRDQGMHYIEE